MSMSSIADAANIRHQWSSSNLVADARFALVEGFERGCLDAAPLLLKDRLPPGSNACGGCHDMCLASAALCRGYECNAADGTCRLLAQAPNHTRPQRFGECWRRRLRSELELADEGMEESTAAVAIAVSGFAVELTADKGVRCSLPREVPLVRWNLLPRVCEIFGLSADPYSQYWESATTAATTTPSCAVDEVAFRGNARPIVATLDPWGEVRGVLYPGFWRPYFWDSTRATDVGARLPGTPLMTGHDVLDRVRVVYVRDAIVTPNGNVCDGSTRCYADAQCFQGDPRNPLVSPVEREGCTGVRRLPVGTHALVLKQEFAHSFSHAIFQALPQLVILLDSFRRRDARRLQERGSASDAATRDAATRGAATRGAATPSTLRILLSRWPGKSQSALPSLIAAALGVPLDDISNNRDAAHGLYITASSASILLVPPGTNPNEAIFGRGILRRAHAGLALRIPDATPNAQVVCECALRFELSPTAP